MSVSFQLPLKDRYKPIGGYGLVGNMRTAALIGFDGSIDWCCLPKFDSPSVFAALLDWRRGGRWAIQPADKASSKQYYRHDTNILCTEFQTADGRALMTDFMPCSVADKEVWSTPPEIHRIVQCIDGEMNLRFLFQPVLDYGKHAPRITRLVEGFSIRTITEEIALSWSNPFEADKGRVNGNFHMAKGDTQSFVLSYGEASPRDIAQYESDKQLAKTEGFWLGWVSQLSYRGRWREMVIRSALTLKLLVYMPTGAIIAAPTTSLPEALGGNRNWDYRYSWIRDSASSLWAFYQVGHSSEAEAYLRWLIDNNPALDLDLKLMYTLLGGTNIHESNLSHLEGYKRSKPVRVGNAASKQVQLDAYGYMLDALYFSSKHGRAVNSEMYFRFVKPLANYIAQHWNRAGNGIWEIRNSREHYVYTKAWCWAGLDRAIRIARGTGHAEDVPAWAAVKQKIKIEVMRRGWNARKKLFAMYYGSDLPDAANLMLPLIGFIKARDRRMRLTVQAIRKDLAKGALVHRYKAKDGLKGKEGAFLLCSFWLVACLARMGKMSEAVGNLDELVGHANHLGLFAEEVDPKTGEALGNFPQAFSHIGLILAATEVDRRSWSEAGSRS